MDQLIFRLKIKNKKDLWDGLFELTESRNRIGILFPCSYTDSIDILQSYITNQYILENHYPDFIKTIISNIKSHNLQDKIHFLPIVTHFHSLEEKRLVPQKLLNNCLSNINDHVRRNWSIIKIQKNDDAHQLSQLVDYKFFQSNIAASFFYTANYVVEITRPDGKHTQHSAMEYMNELFNIIRNQFTNEVAKRTYELNLPPFKSVPLSLGPLIEKRASNKGLQIGKILFCRFSPSYNLRIRCQGATEATALAGSLSAYEARVLASTTKKLNLRVMMQDKDKLVSIHASRVIDFLSDLGVTKEAIEHFYRFSFLTHKYCIKLKTVPKTFPTEFFDFRFVDESTIDYGDQVMLATEFIARELFLTDFKKSAKKVETGVEIEEKNIIYFIDFVKCATKKSFLQNLFFKDIAHYYDHPHSSADAPNQPPILPIRGNVVNTILQFAQDSNPDRSFQKHKLLKKAISVLSKYVYVSCTKLIIDAVKHKDSKNLHELRDRLISFVNDVLNQAYLASDDGYDNFLFFVYIFEEVAIFSYLKGNFFLFEIIGKIFTDNINVIISSIRSLDKVSIVRMNFAEIKQLYDTDFHESVPFSYSSHETMIVIPTLQYFEKEKARMSPDEIFARELIENRICELPRIQKGYILGDVLPNEKICNEILALPAGIQFSVPQGGASTNLFSDLEKLFKSHLHRVTSLFLFFERDKHVSDLREYFHTILEFRAQKIKHAWDFVHGNQDNKRAASWIKLLVKYNFAHPVLVENTFFQNFGDTRDVIISAFNSHNVFGDL